MPFKKKKYTKKRAYKKRSYRRKTNVFSRMAVPSGMPLIRRAKLRYVDSPLITSTFGVLQTYNYRANSIYDPDFAFGGHQPMGMVYV